MISEPLLIHMAFGSIMWEEQPGTALSFRSDEKRSESVLKSFQKPIAIVDPISVLSQAAVKRRSQGIAFMASLTQFRQPRFFSFYWKSANTRFLHSR